MMYFFNKAVFFNIAKINGDIYFFLWYNAFLIISSVLIFFIFAKTLNFFQKKDIDILIFLWYNLFVAMRKAAFRGMETAGENSGKSVPWSRVLAVHVLCSFKPEVADGTDGGAFPLHTEA